MDEALFARLAEWLADGRDVILASVTATHGATPRKRDARMLIDAERIAFSVGGGAMEGRVIAAARAMIRDGVERDEVSVELNGRADSVGVCGGGMRVALRRWQGAAARARASDIATRLAAGDVVELRGEEQGIPDAQAQRLHPKPRLLIAGAGHCGQAGELARFVDFEVWVADSRAECFARHSYAGATCIDTDAASLRAACATARDLYIVLLNRDYATDVAALTALHGVRHVFLGMMGSRKRIAQVKKALPELAGWLSGLVAPVGIDIGEQTPHEIAISILAQLIARRARDQDDADASLPFNSR